MKWEEIEFEKLEVGDVFTHGSAPDKAYHVDESVDHDDTGRYLIASNILIKRTTAGGLCFSGHGEPYHKLILANTPGIDELAARNVVLQEQLARKIDRVHELLARVPQIEW